MPPSALGAALIGIAMVCTIDCLGRAVAPRTVTAARRRCRAARYGPKQRDCARYAARIKALAGFGVADAQGNWTGFDVELCRAVAAAIFDDPRKVRFIPLSAKDRFTALQSGDIDVLSRNTTWTMSRDTQLGFDFAAVTYYDGQAFMVRNKLAIASAKELNGASICVAQGTTNELNVADYFRAAGWKYQMVTFATNEETIKAYEVQGAAMPSRPTPRSSPANGSCSPIRRSTPSCPTSSPRSRSARWFATATTNGRTSFAGPTWRW